MSDNVRAGDLYVVLTGGVGTGKSKLTERVCEVTGISSNSSNSVTSTAKVYRSPHGICLGDTPGNDGDPEKQLQENMWIGHALGHAQVNLVLLCIKADDHRVDPTVHKMADMLDRFEDCLGTDMLCFCITFMDKAVWSKDSLLAKAKKQLGYSPKVIFTQKDTTGVEIASMVREEAVAEAVAVDVNGENFFEFFPIKNSARPIAKVIKQEKTRYKRMVDQFKDRLSTYPEGSRMDLVFDFQRHAEREVCEAQKRLVDKCQFDYVDETEYGHVAFLINSLIAILLDVRVIAAQYHIQVKSWDIRECHVCGKPWLKVDGCGGVTTCGNLPTNLDNASLSSSLTRSTFSFEMGHNPKDNLVITQNQDVSAGTYTSERQRGSKKEGCGNRIDWSTMKPWAPKNDEQRGVFDSLKTSTSVPSVADFGSFAHRARFDKNPSNEAKNSLQATLHREWQEFFEQQNKQMHQATLDGVSA